LLKFSTSALFRYPCLCVGKSSCHTIKKWCNFKRFNTILNNEIVMNFIHKMKCLTDKCHLCFVFALATLKRYVYFRIGNTIGIPTEYRQLAICYMCFVLSLHLGI